MRKVRTFSSDPELVIERRNHIVKVAAELITKKGYNNTSTRELATALGMSTGGLYHYIGSKEDILYLLINFTAELTADTMVRFAALDHEDPAGEIRQSLRIYLETVDYYRDFVNFVNHIMLSLDVGDRRIAYEAESRLVDYFENLLRSGVQKGVFGDHDSKLTAHNIVTVASAWANRGWYLKRHYTLDRYAREQTEAVLAQVSAKRPDPAKAARKSSN